MVYLGVELIILLIAVTVFLMVAWQRSSAKYRKLTAELTAQLKDNKRKLTNLKDSTPGTNADNNILREEIETLKTQLEQARNNPFMQEKIDALTAENEDLQAELDGLRNR